MKTYLIVCLFLSLFASVQAQGNSLANIIFKKEVVLEPESGFFVGGWGGGAVSAPEVIVDGFFVPENYQWDQDGCVWWDQHGVFNVQQAIYIDLGQTVEIGQLIGQFDHNDGYIVSYRNLDSGQWELAWHIDRDIVPGGGMVTRPVPYDATEMYVLNPPIVTDALRIQGDGGDSWYSVSEIQAFGSCPLADFTGDCFVNLEDYAILSEAWLCFCPDVFDPNTMDPSEIDDPNIPCQLADIDNSWFVDLPDLTLMADQWLTSPLFTSFFTSNLINNTDANELEPYIGQSLANYVDASLGTSGLTFKVFGLPNWLVVESDGTLLGTPKAADVGLNTFTVRVEDVVGQFDIADMTIQVANIYNGTQGMEDLLGFADQWLMTGCTDTPACNGADLDDYDDVTLLDYSILAHNWLITEDLQLWLKFDEMAGTIVNDSSIYWRTGTLYNSPTWESSYAGGALNFDGSNYVEITDDAGLNPDTDSFSVAFWMKSDMESQGALIVSKRQSTSPYPGYIIGLSNGTPTTFTTGNKLTFLFGSETGDRKGGYTNAEIVFSEWTHVCVVLDQDADTVYVYIDGVPANVYISPNDTLTMVNTTTPLYIGQNPSVSSKPYYGLVDGVRIYNKALTAQEVSEISQ